MIASALPGVLLVLATFLPIALACAIVTTRGRAVAEALLPFAALPALAIAVLPEGGARLGLPVVLLGLELGLEPGFDGGRRLVLAFTALIWSAAGIYGRGYLQRDGNRHRYNAFFLLTMGGNLGLVLARDVPGFYLFFSLMTLASYLLVVHERTPAAYRAGRVYIVLSLLGETLLLLGFLLAVDAADSILIADVRAALATGPTPYATLLLLFGGFAVKAGIAPLHVWLPLAHTAAPTPASAVLSGAMIKTGLLGMALFLPVGEASLPHFGLALSVVGVATAFYGVACGLPQVKAKGVLAYSSLSQMGVMVAALGYVLAVPQAHPVAAPALAIYAAHHGLTKAALFFSVGVIARAHAGRGLAIAMAALCGFALAGAPLTGGALAKHFVKKSIDAVAIEWAASLAGLLSLSAVATALLMLRFVFVVSAEGNRARGAGAGLLLWVPFVAVAVLGQALPWWLFAKAGQAPWQVAASAYGLWEGFWPPAAALLLGAGTCLAARHLPHFRAPAVPLGDWLALVSARVEPRSGTAWRAGNIGGVLQQFRHGAARLAHRLVSALVRVESELVTRGAVAITALGLALAFALVW